MSEIVRLSDASAQFTAEVGNMLTVMIQEAPQSFSVLPSEAPAYGVEKSLASQQNCSSYIITNHSGVISGVAITSKTRDSLLIEDLYVLPPERGLGLGSRLLEYCHEQASREELAYSQIVIGSSNFAGRAFVKRKGFKVLSPRSVKYSGIYPGIYSELLERRTGS